jgi:hypothetical protein
MFIFLQSWQRWKKYRNFLKKIFRINIFAEIFTDIFLSSIINSEN